MEDQEPVAFRLDVALQRIHSMELVALVANLVAGLVFVLEVDPIDDSIPYTDSMAVIVHFHPILCQDNTLQLVLAQLHEDDHHGICPLSA